MMASLDVKVQVFVIEAEPDGSACISCGDGIYLGAYLVEARIGLWVVGVLPGLLCGSCGEALKGDDGESWKRGKIDE